MHTHELTCRKCGLKKTVVKIKHGQPFRDCPLCKKEYIEERKRYPEYRHPYKGMFGMDAVLVQRCNSGMPCGCEYVRDAVIVEKTDERVMYKHPNGTWSSWHHVMKSDEPQTLCGISLDGKDTVDPLSIPLTFPDVVLSKCRRCRKLN